MSTGAKVRVGCAREEGGRTSKDLQLAWVFLPRPPAVAEVSIRILDREQELLVLLFPVWHVSRHIENDARRAEAWWSGHGDERRSDAWRQSVVMQESRGEHLYCSTSCCLERGRSFSVLCKYVRRSRTGVDHISSARGRQHCMMVMRVAKCFSLWKPKKITSSFVSRMVKPCTARRNTFLFSWSVQDVRMADEMEGVRPPVKW